MADNSIVLYDMLEAFQHITRVLDDISRNLIAIEAAILGVDEAESTEPIGRFTAEDGPFA